MVNTLCENSLVLGSVGAETDYSGNRPGGRFEFSSGLTTVSAPNPTEAETRKRVLPMLAQMWSIWTVLWKAVRRTFPEVRSENRMSRLYDALRRVEPQKRRRERQGTSPPSPLKF